MNIKKTLKRQLAVMLSFLLMVSTMLVGTISTNAATSITYTGGEKLYFNMNAVSWWNTSSSGGGNYAYFFGLSGTAWSTRAVVAKGNTYAVDVPAGTWEYVILTRNSVTSNPDWNNKWNQTGNIELDPVSNNITSFAENSANVTWNVYAPDVASVTPTVTGYESGSGTESDPYVYNVGDAAGISATSTLALSDSNAVVQYAFNSDTFATESSATIDTSAEVDASAYTVKARSTYQSYTSSTSATATVYYTVKAAETEPPTEEPTTEVPTEAPTEEPTTEVPTEPTTEVPTEPTTEVPTEPTTEVPTEAPTEEPTTEVPTEPTTEVPTEPTTEVPTEPTTEAPTTVPVETFDYYVAGDAALTGSSWNPSDPANGMTANGDGTYTKVYTDVPAGSYSFKVTDGSWNNSWGKDGQNYGFTLSYGCDVTINFDSNTKEITLVADALGDFTLDYIVAVGNGEGTWLNGEVWVVKSETNIMTEVESGVWQIAYEDVAAGTDYQVKFACNGSYTYNWNVDGVFDGQINTPQVVDVDGSTVTLTIDVNGFDFNTMTGSVAITFDAVPPETEPTTEVPTEPTTEAPTEPTTEAPTEPTTEVPTEPTTEVPTEPTTEVPTEPTTEVPTEPTTEVPTEPTTEVPTEPTTEVPTEPTTTPVPETKTIYVGVATYLYNETSASESSYQIHYWDSATSGDANCSYMDLTTQKDVGYWISAPTFRVYSAEIPADSTGFKFHIANRWFGADGDATTQNSVYVFNYSGDKAVYSSSKYADLAMSYNYVDYDTSAGLAYNPDNAGIEKSIEMTIPSFYDIADEQTVIIDTYTANSPTIVSSYYSYNLDPESITVGENSAVGSMNRTATTYRVSVHNAETGEESNIDVNYQNTVTLAGSDYVESTTGYTWYTFVNGKTVVLSTADVYSFIVSTGATVYVKPSEGETVTTNSSISAPSFEIYYTDSGVERVAINMLIDNKLADEGANYLGSGVVYFLSDENGNYNGSAVTNDMIVAAALENQAVGTNAVTSSGMYNMNSSAAQYFPSTGSYQFIFTPTMTSNDTNKARFFSFYSYVLYELNGEVYAVTSEVGITTTIANAYAAG